MKNRMNLLGMVLAVSLCWPMAAFAVKAHTQPCSDCHRTGADPRKMSNVCTPCHGNSAAGGFSSTKASDALNHHPDNPPDPAVTLGNAGDQTSHFWGGTSINQLAAGAAMPPTTFYVSRYAISTNKITCSICHDPHGQVNSQLLRATKDNDLICQQCHIGFYVDNPQAQKTHPIGDPTIATYEAARTAPANAGKFNPTLDGTNFTQGDNGGVALVNGYVSCSSCHSVHFADSNSATVDGMAAVAVGGLAAGDGHLLKADGPFQANKSALCQTCHTYKEHGKVGNNAAGSGVGDVKIGCLVCHSGHSYDATAPNFFVLRKTVDSGVAGFGGKTDLLYTTYPLPAASFAAYCIKCHGAVTGYTLRPHSLPADNDCKVCHAHNATAYSFAQGGSGTACSSCHGAPPRTNTVADRVDNTNPDTGYAIGSGGINYLSPSQNGKDESQTPHKRHAGALNADKATVDYAFGSGTTLSACLPCHNDKEDAVSPVSPTHDTADSNLSFQDVYFNSMATYNGVLTAPLYKKTSGGGQWACSGIYCHSNGGKRPTTGAAKVLADFKTATTPAWPLGSNNTTNIGTIVGIALECQQCHGVTVATMAVAQKSNSQTHNKHLTKFGDGKTSCYLCHSATVDSSGTIPASARDHRFGGTHVNGTPNVVFSSTAFGGDLATGTYASGATQGTCVVYCHSDAIGGPPAIVPDWDFPTGTIVCGSCHGITSATLTSGSHFRHLDSTKAKIKCSSCHGLNADTGTHTGHVDGAITRLTNAASCDLCHGVELASGKAWDVSPTWGSAGSIDCRTCHTGSVLTSYVNTAAVTISVSAGNNLSKPLHETDGHSRPTPYILTGKPAASKNCSACHVTLIDLGTGHVDGLGTSKLLIGGFSCEACHTAAGVRSGEATVDVQSHGNQTAGYTKKAYNAAFTKPCLACHDPHGTSNGAMIENLRTKQNAKDASANFAGDVVFSSLINANSFDEADSGAGANNDDLCATCHSTTLHNNRGVTGTHSSYEGTNCTTTCHQHNGAKGGFMPTGGTACNSCHGNPPSLSDDRPPGKIGVHAAHTRVGTHAVDEDKFDCDVCHPGAATFGLSHAAVPLASGITNTTCANACHKSTAGDGSWTDSNGLACTACHYWGSPPNSLDNNNSGKTLTGSHNKHFDKSKTCISCHPNNGSDVMAPHIHIDNHDAWTLNATNDGTVLQDLGAATPDEATVDFTAATTKYGNWNDTANTCGVATANNGLGCHATGAPTWGAAGPLACIACHSDKSTSQVNPTSGLHGVTPLVSGKQHDESFTYNAGANTADCTTCHTATPTVTATDHQNGTLDATRGATGNTKIKFDAPIGYSDAVAPTCAPSLTGCHYEQPTKLVDWKRKWHEGATSNTGACAGCHGDWVNGWNADVQHHTNAKAQSTHGTKGGKTWECMDCHGLESVTLTPYPFTISSNDWRQNAGESTTLHGNGVINVNSSGTGFLRIGAISGCPTCHTNWQTDGKHAYTKTEWTLATILADAPTVTCATCHGGLTAASVANYWPDKPGNDGTEDNLGRHLLHMTSLAKAKYNEDITALLTNNVNGDADVKQKYLCAYCHTVPGGDFDHGDTANLPAEVFVSNAVRSSKSLWDVADSDATYASGNCTSVNCHNGKATATTATFDWYGAGTHNCALCHNDITGAGATGVTHNAHMNEPKLGKVIACSSCHGSGVSATWDSNGIVPDNYAPPTYSSGHINGTLNLGTTSSSTVSFTYSPNNYVDYAVHTFGSCAINLCHNNGKNGTTTYTWGTAITGTCTACHGNTDTGLAEGHDGHLLASSTYGKTISCQDCHEAVSSTDMTGKTNHMSGTVNLTGVTYNGDLAVSGTTWGQCSASSCHRSSPATTVNSPLWNTTASGCSTCHGSTAATLTSGRHEDHLPNAYIISKCGECHTANANNTSMAGQANHINGSVDIGGSKTLSFSSPGCTSNCHFVDSAARGDWLDANSLTCTDCHSGTFLGKANKDNTSGLHQAINALRHNDSFGVGGNCSSCHSGIVVSTNSPATHMDTTPSVNNTQFGLFGNYSTTNGNCTASCHRDGGQWKRKWIGVTDAAATGAPGQAVCNNCHGQYSNLTNSTGWNDGTVHYRSGSGAAENKGDGHTDASPNQCQDCHGYPVAGTHNSNAKIDFSGGGTAYTLTWGTNGTNPGWFCLMTGCHVASGAGIEDATATASHTLLDSLAFPSPTRATPEKIVYVTGTTTPTGGCTGCHGNSGTGGFWPDSSNGNTMNVKGAHPEHVQAIADKMTLDAPTGPGTGTLTEKNATCNYCHPGNSHGGDGTEPADVSNTDTDNNNIPDLNTGSKLKKIVGGADDTGGLYGGFYRSTPGTCSYVACHASAPFTPHWYADTVLPGEITDLELQANTEPGTVKLLWNAPGNDGALDGTAYSYDLRYSTAPITEGNFASAIQAQAPTVKRKHTGPPKNQEIIVKGLPTGTLYFAVKTYDEAGNASLISNVASGTAQTDNVAPIFWGISAVSATDHSFDITTTPDTNSVYVSWEAGRDHGHSLTSPLSYLVLWSEYSLRAHFSNSGAMPATIGTDACFSKLAPATQVTCGSVVPASNEYRIKSASTTALDYNVTGLPAGTVYNFLVRAKDPAGNIDSNRVDMMAMAKSTVYQPINLKTLYTSATIPAVSTGWTGLLSTSASDAALGASYPGTAPANFTPAQNEPVVWSPASTYLVNTNVWGLNFQVKLGSTSSSAATTWKYHFGYLTGKVFTGLGTEGTYVLPRRALRVVKFPLSAFKGTIPAGSKPAFVLTNTSSTAIPIIYGSTANKGGMLLFNEQEYNDLPTGLGALSQSQVVDPYVGGNVYRLTWNAAVPVNVGQTVHYDVFGSIDGGNTWPYVIGRNLTTNTVDWDPLGDGITGNQANVMFKVMAGDGYRTGLMVNNGAAPTNPNNVNHSEATSSAFSVNNTVDIWTPAAIGSAVGTADDLKAETRPKQGSVYLTWKAVGNDGFNHGTRATQYDIRFSTSAIPDLATFNALPVANQAKNEPYPDFTGAVEGYELLGLNPDVPYYIAMKVGDAVNNWSGLSNVVSTQSGPKCGICHSTPPDETATAGNHIKHGYTKNDCANCHGSAAANFNTDHQDGALYLGWKTASPVLGVVNDVAGTVTYTQNSTLIYSDTINGVGGFNQTIGGTTKVDDGTCSGFNGTNTSGCHGPATPSWIAGTTLSCSACHGLSSRTTDTYGRAFDATLDNGSVVPDEIKAAPAVDNHGTSTGKYVGAHLKHLNSSFRLAKGDNCKLCHNDNVHADGTVDVAYDLNVTGVGALWTPNATGAGTPGTCAGTTEINCHGTNTPSWDSAATVACNECHGFGGKSFPVGSAPTINGGAGVIAHVSDGNIVRACTWCHAAGHPQGTVQEPLTIMIPNNPIVGIAYRSGGIHLLKTINGRGPFTTEAEVCWACHDVQSTKITEWGTNNNNNTGASPYNYGALFTAVGFTGPTLNWLGLGTGAYWQSGTTAFQTIKKGKIQSIHTADPAGTSVVTYDATNKRYNETLDSVAIIRCSNCHDVHNMNKTENDTVIGTPYLRGTWMGNPYNEDGPPLSTTTYLAVAANGNNGFGAVPRGGTGYRQLGGYFIDQNNVTPMTASATANATIDDYPTAGWTMENSAGLCILCHSNDVDNMNQNTTETSLWLGGTNGHSNSALGGSFGNSSNIFDNGAGTASLSGRPTPVYVSAVNKTTHVPDMAYALQGSANNGGATCTRGFGYRGCSTSNTGAYTPLTSATYAHLAYDWGATVDAGTKDQMYHQFSCSKCHNPHASRLPKLMITNCLDIQHNTWDDNKTAQTLFTAATLDDVDNTGATGWRSAYYASAQNCHRYNNLRTAVNKGGWNTVTPWTTANQ